MSADISTTMREVFGLFDRDGDGLILGAELPTVVRATGVNPRDEEFDKLLAGKDTDMFDYAKFEAFCSPLLKGKDVQAGMKSSFKPFDRDNSGFLSSGELKHVMRNLKSKLTDEDIDNLIAAADPSGSGKIRHEDLIQLLTA